MPNPRPVAVVTGASGGIGGAIVRDLASSHEVYALGRNADRLAAIASATGAIPWVVDITDVDRLAELISALPRLDVLVQAAAIGSTYSVDAATAATWNEHLATNVVGPAELTRLALPLLREAEGTVIFIGSGASTRPVPGSAVYTATKHALRGLADVLRIDEEPHRLRVVTIAPGQTDTQLLRASVPAEAYEASRYIRPESIAATARFVIDAPADVHLTDVTARPRQEIARI